MNRFLTLTSSTLIATGLAVLPIAAFAQTANPAGTDAAKTPTTMTTTPATQAPVATTATQTPVATTAKKDTLPSTQPSQIQAGTQTQVKPNAVTKSDTKSPVRGKKAEMHSMNTGKTHPAAKTAPAQDQKG